MTDENKPKITIAEMLRVTGSNTAQFMEQVALHIEKLEYEVLRLEARVFELESKEDER